MGKLLKLFDGPTSSFSPVFFKSQTHICCTTSYQNPFISPPPPGRKSSLKPAALTQHPGKPLNFTHCRLIHFLQCGVLIVASVWDFDYHFESFQSGGVSVADRCKNPSNPPPPPHSDTSGSSLFLFHSLPFSAACRPSSKRRGLAPGANCFSQHKSPRRKMGEKRHGKRKGIERARRKSRTEICPVCSMPTTLA